MTTSYIEVVFSDIIEVDKKIGVFDYLLYFKFVVFKGK